MECSRREEYLSIVASLLLVSLCTAPAAAAKAYRKMDTWPETMKASRNAFKVLNVTPEEKAKLADRAVTTLMQDYPVQADWMIQDFGLDCKAWFLAADNTQKQTAMIEGILEEIGDAAGDLRARFDRIVNAKLPADDIRWLSLYEKACAKRRKLRLANWLTTKRRVVFTKHFNMGGSHYAYTEAQSDAQAERSFRPGTSLCILEMDGPYGKVKKLIEDAKGVIRDPDVSFDGKRILFSWKKSDREDDYHLYEMDVATGAVRQITSGLGFADYEAMYLANDDIIFNSTRCVQIVDCWWTEVSNLYRCDKDGRFLRRLSFDQVHTNFPTVMDDGRIIYTRWDYNDRGQLYPQPLYQMNPDGTSQMEFYGNNSWFPTTILHARGIPGTKKVLAIATGHHSRQTGKLIIIDPARGRQENAGVQLISPVRETKAERIDAYGQNGELFQYPYPLSETEYLVTYSPYGWGRKPVLFGIYHMTIDGKRELLAADAKISCNQSVPLEPRPKHHPRPTIADYQQPHGTYYVQDIYRGHGLKDVPRGTIKKLRVIEIQFRAAGVKSNRNGGPAGGALVSTPIAVNNGCWDVKVVLGDAKVYKDGSVCFNVPARTPVYFQAIDEKGYAVQSMRTWSTLQPGETFSCVGCHESKDETPTATSKPTMAMAMGPQDLTPFYGPRRGFSFPREIQPILDRHCITCHNDRSTKEQKPVAKDSAPGAKIKAFTLLDAPNFDQKAGRIWSDAYYVLTCNGNPNKGAVRWLNVQSIPPLLPPYFAGSTKSPLMKMLEEGHNGVNLSGEEMEKIACWIDLLVPYCGDYMEANCWNEAELKKYLHYQKKRDEMAVLEANNIRDLIAPAKPAQGLLPTSAEALNPYRNVAVNPDDVQGYARSWPHASSNSEYRNMPAFAARNAIDGKTANTGHGPKFPSWGPHKQKDLWWKVDLGRLVETDRIVIHIRADFPHDDHWKKAKVQFSDGTSESITIAKTAQPQEYKFKKRIISWVRLTDLMEDEPLGWCGLSEVEIWGRDVYSPGEALATVANAHK